jgi:sugar (pentulose or hexulose) kinase
MTITRNYLAVDLGAESGRAIVGTLTDRNLTITETYRFSNDPVRLPDGLHWDVLRLWSEIKSGISASALKFDGFLNGIGLDAWGVDFALLDKNGELLSNPFHYRDNRTDDMLTEAFRRMSREKIYENTGIQFMQINTLYQLLSMVVRHSPLLDVAQRLVTIPDLLNYWLSGQITCEFTNATTTQCYDPRKRDWATPVLEALGIPTHMFGPVTQPGTVLGTLPHDLVKEIATISVPIIAPACHDTGSAVVAVPAEDKDFVWISSGTWSIVGTEVKEPNMSFEAERHNFTNEGGVFDSWRLSKNVMGLWLVQACRHAWQRDGETVSYDKLTDLASQAQPFLAVIDPDYPEFLPLGNMPERIREFCRSTGQPVPGSCGDIIRIILESIALKYRWAVERLEVITLKQFDTIHIVGGGIKNRLLNQFTADATGCVCIAGPVEATATGNILMQAITLGHIDSLADARAIVRQSFTPEVYTPSSRIQWDMSYSILKKLLK